MCFCGGWRLWKRFVRDLGGCRAFVSKVRLDLDSNVF